MLRPLFISVVMALIVMICPFLARAEAARCEPVPEALAKFKPSDSGPPDEPVKFMADGEREITLLDYRGRGVVLNFWATWCAPCVKEMPALDALRASLADDGIEVLAASSDFGGAQAVRDFYASKEIEQLPVLTDLKGRTAQSLGVVGLPTTVLFDADGAEVGRVQGAAEWDDPEVATFLRACLAPSA